MFQIQWWRGFMLGAATARFLRWRVRRPQQTWMFVVECCVSSGSGLSDGQLILQIIPTFVVCLKVISKFQKWGGFRGLGKINL
jgi:hypothetical protein